MGTMLRGLGWFCFAWEGKGVVLCIVFVRMFFGGKFCFLMIFFPKCHTVFVFGCLVGPFFYFFFYGLFFCFVFPTI